MPSEPPGSRLPVPRALYLRRMARMLIAVSVDPQSGDGHDIRCDACCPEDPSRRQTIVTECPALHRVEVGSSVYRQSELALRQ